MFSPHEHTGFRVQPIEYPNGLNHLPEVHEQVQLPEAVQNKPAPIIEEANPSNVSQQQESPEHRNPFGLTPLAFGVLVALVTASIVGAAIGGGLGGALGNKEKCQTFPSEITSTESYIPTSTLIPISSTVIPSSSTSTISTALVDYVAPEPSLVQTLHINCPELDGTIIEDTKGDQYQVTCGYRILGNPSILTYSGLAAYSLQDCIQACFLLNNWGGGGQKLCAAVSWCKAMSYSAEINAGANCWLFNSSSNALSIESNHTIAVMST